MLIHPVVVQVAGIVSVTMTTSFVGGGTDTTDQQRILAYGDPLVNLGGLFTDPANMSFSFIFPASELWVGVTTQIAGYTARFMAQQPFQPAGAQPAWAPVPWPNTNTWPNFQCPPPNANPALPGQGQLDCVTSNPIEAATAWAAVMETRIEAAMVVLRALTPASLTTLPNATI